MTTSCGRRGAGISAVEHALEDFCLDGTDRDLAEAAQRLLGDGLLAEPAMVYRAMGLLADVGALSAENLRTRADRPRDPMRPGGPAIGREAGRIRGIQAVTRGRSGISMVCITGPAGVGKTRLAEEIAAACEQEGATPRLEVRLSRAAVGRELQRRAVNGHEALLDLLLLLGVAEGDVPAIPAERKARYAAELAGMRPVILIDGAIDENQVLDLLPPAAGAVVVTSRRHLPGLFDRGAEHLRLNPLSRVGSRLLIQRCFQPQAMPDDAAITAISAATAGMPVPTIILSRWMATAAEDAMPAGAGNEDAEDAMPAGAGNKHAHKPRAANEDAEDECPREQGTRTPRTQCPRGQGTRTLRLDGCCWRHLPSTVPRSVRRSVPRTATWPMCRLPWRRRMRSALPARWPQFSAC